jgi:transposase
MFFFRQRKLYEEEKHQRVLQLEALRYLWKEVGLRYLWKEVGLKYLWKEVGLRYLWKEVGLKLLILV